MSNHQPDQSTSLTEQDLITEQMPDSGDAAALGVADADFTESHDLSMKSTPDEWFQAEQQSPQDPAWRKGRVRVSKASLQPARQRVNSFTLFASGLLATIIAGGAWMAAELLGLFGTAWLAIPAGVLIALIIRAGGGAKDPEGRSTVAAIAYLLMLLVVLGLLTRQEIYEVYGNTTDVVLLEENLFRRRFSGIDQLAAYAIGWAATWYTSMALRA